MSRSDTPPSFPPHTAATITDVPVPPAEPEGEGNTGAEAGARSKSGPIVAGDRFAAWVLRGPLVVLLAGLGLLQLGTWMPHYLTWPYWADHDVFATLAQGWDDGLLPYRDLRCNNFPGTIYMFWILGKVFGWGRSLPFYAVDAALLTGLGAMVLIWSRRRLGGIIPGLVGYLTFLSYYLGLDYAHAAQRDWQGPCFAVISVMAAQVWPSRAGRIGSALAMALAICIRPQAVLLLPALALAIDETSRPAGESVGATLRGLMTWGLSFTVFLALLFVPLALAGVLGDFVQGVRLTAYGNHYNRVTPSTFLVNWIQLIAPLRTALIPVVMGVLALRTDGATRRMALVWIAALVFGSLYKPLSPMAHSYLDIPLTLIWSISLAVLVHLLMPLTCHAPSLQLAAILMVLALGVTMRPLFCMVGPAVRAVASFRHGQWPEGEPPGYRRGSVPTSSYYPWADYQAMVEYLKRQTAPDTRLANILKGDPAVTSPAARHSVFPAESMAWLRMLCPEQEGDFAKDLEQTPNSVVVWIPDEIGPDPEFKIDQLTAVVRRLYEPEARFGEIEVWRRKGTAQARHKAHSPAKPRPSNSSRVSSARPAEPLLYRASRG